MKVILVEKVEKLGEPGDMKEVANGYARNFLLPRGLAIPATTGAVKELENRRSSAQRRQEQVELQARQQAGRMNGLSVLLYARTGEQNRLYGSITAADVAEALRVQHQVEVDRRRVKIDQPIHRTGTYTATVNVGRNLNSKVNLIVEAESQRSGGALTSIAEQAPAVAAPAAAAAPEAEAALEMPELSAVEAAAETPELTVVEAPAVQIAAPEAEAVLEMPELTAVEAASETPEPAVAKAAAETPELNAETSAETALVVTPEALLPAPGELATESGEEAAAGAGEQASASEPADERETGA